MITSNKFENKKIAVFGLGRAGLSAVTALGNSYAKVYAWDDNESSQQQVNDLKLKNVLLKYPNIIDWKNMDYLVLSPGVPFTHPEPHEIVALANSANCPIICDIELLYQATRPAKFIGITGTNGKSTTTSLIGHIFEQDNQYYQLGGNIGVPVLDLEMLSGNGTYIVEMSSYQLDLIDETRFHISVLLNITPDHLERHGGMDGYIEAKIRIFTNQQKGDITIIGIDNENSRKVYEKLKATRSDLRLIPIAVESELSAGVCVKGNKLINNLSATAKEFDLGDLKYLPGIHNKQNIAASFAACYASGINDDQIIKSIKSFMGLKHRIQLIKEKNGIQYVNDSKATNAEAASKALASYDNIYWILGGVAKEGGIDDLTPFFSKIKKAYLIGESQDEFASSLDGKVNYHKSGDLKTALEQARYDAEKNAELKQVILLSPACASFDQWKDFEKRGDEFCKLVAEI